MPERLRLTFRYALGERVRYDGAVWTVAAQCWQRGTVSTFVSYLLTAEGQAGRTTYVYEPDVQPTDEKP
jgi:hypothetical protein